MKSLSKIKVLRVSTNILMIVSFIFMAYSLDNIIIKLTALPISIWLSFIIIRVLSEKTIILKIDSLSQIEINDVLYNHEDYTYNLEKFTLGLKFIPILLIEDKYEFMICSKYNTEIKFNASTFSEEDRNKLEIAVKKNKRYKKEKL